LIYSLQQPERKLLKLSEESTLIRLHYSVLNGALNSSGARPSLAKTLLTDADLLEEMKKLGAPRKPHLALHAPHIFLKVANGLGCSNIATITAAMTDAWKVDVLRDF
jgi:hypothetical protein